MRNALCLLLLVCAAAPGRSEDWPRWRGPDNTGRARSGSVRALPSAPRVLWRVKVGGGYASPVVAGGRVFHMDAREGREAVSAVDARTGREIWSHLLDPVFVDNQKVPGPRTTPVVDGALLFVQTCRGELQCRRTSDGSLVWRTNYVIDLGAPVPAEAGDSQGASRHGYTGAPLVDGDRLYACAGSPKGASVVALDKRTGRVLWRAENDEAGYSGPVLARLAGKNQVVCFTSDGVIGLDPATGALLWRHPLKTIYGRHVMDPVVVRDTVLVGSHTQGLLGVRVTAVNGAARAEQAWIQRPLAVNFSSPVAVGQHVYGLGPARRLFCVDAVTGRTAWMSESAFAGEVNSDHAAFLAVGDRIMALTDTGQLLLFAADPTGYREVSRARVCGETWASPALADGRLYVRDTENLVCIDLAR